jgi:hypothetical protein
VVIIGEEKKNKWHFNPSDECCPAMVGFKNLSEPKQV